MEKLVTVEPTKWFDATKFEPGQPGVFEVDPVYLDDGTTLRRFSFFDGKKFGSVCVDPAIAYERRLSTNRFSVFTHFRGLTEQAA